MSTGVAVACCVAVYYLAQNNSEVTTGAEAPKSRTQNQVKGWDARGESWGELQLTPDFVASSTDISWNLVKNCRILGPSLAHGLRIHLYHVPRDVCVHHRARSSGLVERWTLGDLSQRPRLNQATQASCIWGF